VNSAWDQAHSVWRNPGTGDFSLTAVPQWTELRRPRIALYRSWIPNIDEGWTRWLLEQFHFAYTSVRNADVQAGRLREKFDAIVIPDQNSGAIDGGYRNGAMPPEYTGGLGAQGAEALREFARAGGTLIFLNRASEFAIEKFELPVKTVTAGAKDYYSPGGVLASGWLEGESVIAGRAALVDAPLGNGHIVLFGMQPQYRAQSYLTLKIFFNALLYR
jgi:hypothetical protein